ncbi:hypothetical protein CSV71_09920 [Sporosarcina sp. P21c]|uniref:hypothetical protein n=1 Tax=Sporosarcina TaxID=1569 RepID=UPI000A14C6D2|nr:MULTISPECIES: hypothetical protein [Sporosarcina]ARJ37415.1 hypothetical protein SporoP8_00115 [Sporosarcina ureae]PIC66960.1 hypothetical protein CSV78_10230 [Sporosarcina sp. P16a]PIC84769.1 hypothetical protein CSV73_02430 [Sporosarcina sp. P1]PIC89460.1 hypothetical protein CSV71_09920 [Sporosarcina sp. P21c]PIC92412.1 hypothetical protein CSV70_10975 [Sporosarcina sp. P25]
MIKEILRAVGIGCLIAGGIVYFVQQQTSEGTLQKQLADSKEDIAILKKELAIAQTLSRKDAIRQPESEQDTIPEENEAEEIVAKSFTVKAGITPAELSRELENEKLIKSAEEFELYIIENDYTRKIKTGTYELRSDMRFPEIAKIFLRL